MLRSIAMMVEDEMVILVMIMVVMVTVAVVMVLAMLARNKKRNAVCWSRK